MMQQVMTGRGAGFNPPNRFETLKIERTPDDLAQYFEDPDPDRNVLTKFYIDHTKTVLAKNDSPDLGFTYSLNPYRGCEHGCVYCYARPSHEYLGFSPGLDFETKIMVKPDVARLLEGNLEARRGSRRWLSFLGTPIAISLSSESCNSRVNASASSSSIVILFPLQQKMPSSSAISIFSKNSRRSSLFLSSLPSPHSIQNSFAQWSPERQPPSSGSKPSRYLHETAYPLASISLPSSPV